MSQSLTNVQQIEYDELVKNIYRSTGFLLRDSVRMKTNVIGYAVDFRRVDQVIAVPTGYSQAVTPQDPNYTKRTCIIQKYTAPIEVDSVEELTVNFDAKMESAMLVGQAMGRRSDQIIIDAAAAAVGDTIVANATNFTYEKFTEVWEFFERNAVPKGDRYLALSASAERSLMEDEQFVSYFYTKNGPLDRGYILQYLGINMICIPDMTEGGLPFDDNTNTRTNLAWHKMAMGMGVGAEFRTEVNYIPQNTAWLINGVFSAGAVGVDSRGIIAIDCIEPA